MNPRSIFFLITAFFSCVVGMAQDKCATVEVLQKRRDRSLLFESDDAFEEWIAKVKTKSHANRVGGYTVPVVVHIIHRGESIGTGTNLSLLQIQSQIEVLNHDFNRTNSDALQTPSEFQSVAGQIEIEFVLARQDPEGNASDGVVRVKGSKSTWSINDEKQLKATSYWPAEDYLNIWVADLSSSILGYAQFPVSDLVGLESAVDNRLTDGIVIDYTVFGSEDFGSFNLNADFRKGRTTTHEVGHFFGLRHIWGDDEGSCSGNDDYVSDTPNQGNNTTGCPVHPRVSCSLHSMFQNYMDYTNDDCMNLFTVGQVSRMVTILENSPRRVSLLSSSGANNPPPVMNSVAILSGSLGDHVCAGTQTLSIRMINNGQNPVTSVEFYLALNGTEWEHDVSFDSPLMTQETVDLNLGDILIEAGDNQITVKAIRVNGVPDDNDKGNTLEKGCYAFFSEALPLREDFDSMPPDWRQDDIDGNVDWVINSAPHSNNSNSALSLAFFNSTTSSESNFFFTPALDFTESKTYYLVFDVAYAQSSAGDADGLKIYAFNDCGNDPAGTGKLIFDKSGNALSTTSVRSTAFVPASILEWRQEIVDVSDLSGNENVRFAFRGVNDQGNNLYVDKVRVVQSVHENIAIGVLAKPGAVHCMTNVNPLISVRNTGSIDIESITVLYNVNGGPGKFLEVSPLNLPVGEERFVELPLVDLNEGTNTLTVELVRPNGLFDSDASNNTLIEQSFVSLSEELVPFRQDFENPGNTWPMAYRSGRLSWESFDTDLGKSMVRLTPENAVSESWIASPVLDLTDVAKSSLYFNIAVLDNTGLAKAEAELRSGFDVKISTDCGVTYQNLPIESVPAIRSDDTDNDAHVPGNWLTMYSSLTPYAGIPSVRLAFVVTASSEYQTYLDNVEIFLTDGDALLTSERPFSLYDTNPDGDGDVRLGFDLAERQPVSYELMDITGRVVETRKIDHVLNQVVTLQPRLSSGIYLLRLTIGSHAYTSRILIAR
jgi:hypothetical protein